jgi:DNA-binding GntR family transcriptional regulator
MIADSLANTAYAQLLDRLLDGRLQAGDRIDRKALAQELGMSTSPVVDALGRLAADGMVEIRPRQGTHVRQVSVRFFRDQLIFRTALETQAARLSCGEPVRQAYPRLHAMCESLNQAARGPELWRAEADFHLALAELCGAQVLIDALRRVLLLSHFAVTHLVFQNRPPRRQHGPLLEALCTDDPDEAAAAVRSHLAVTRETVLQQGAMKQDVVL